MVPGPLLSKNLKLVIPAPGSAKSVLEYYLRNRSRFKEWEPHRSEGFYTVKYHRSAIRQSIKKLKEGKEYRFRIIKKEDKEMQKVIGILSFSNIVKGPFLSCFAGYSMESTLQNKGYMTQALKAGIEFIFNTIGLHRIEANIMPVNSASLRVVTKLGFENEGLSPNYLQIAGKWEDHIHMVLRNRNLE